MRILANGLESSTVKTPEFKAFARTFKREFSKELEKVGAKLERYTVGHFFVSGFFTNIHGKIFYFSVEDVRDRNVSMLYRTAKDFGDFSGGLNQWSEIYPDMVYHMNIR